MTYNERLIKIKTYMSENGIDVNDFVFEKNINNNGQINGVNFSCGDVKYYSSARFDITNWEDHFKDNIQKWFTTESYIIYCDSKLKNKLNIFLDSLINE